VQSSVPLGGEPWLCGRRPPTAAEEQAEHAQEQYGTYHHYFWRAS